MKIQEEQTKTNPGLIKLLKAFLHAITFTSIVLGVLAVMMIIIKSSPFGIAYIFIGVMVILLTFLKYIDEDYNF